MDPVISSVLRFALGWILAESAYDKLRHRRDFRRTLAAYQLVPGSALAPVAWGLAAIEATLALSLGLGALAPWAQAAFGGVAAPAGVTSAALLALYGAAITINLVRGRRDLDCGCGGPARHQQLGVTLVVRNALLVSAALAAAKAPEPRALSGLDLATTVLAITATLLLRGAGEVLLANGPASARLAAEMRA